jgi:hypothetical protein
MAMIVIGGWRCWRLSRAHGPHLRSGMEVETEINFGHFLRKSGLFFLGVHLYKGRLRQQKVII